MKLEYDRQDAGRYYAIFMLRCARKPAHESWYESFPSPGKGVAQGTGLFQLKPPALPCGKGPTGLERRGNG